MAAEDRSTPAQPATPGVERPSDTGSNPAVRLALLITAAAGVSLIAVGFVMAYAGGRIHPTAVPLGSLWNSHDDGGRLMAVGTLVLALAPVAGLGASLISWLHQRDWRFAAAALLVLAVLVAATGAGGAF
ncbi:MAG TPA: DUF1634 domain-containing protein [Acidimicrobiales bacterium]|nr:DUF1634 domain-containing protein [Acidimicrobiales bacterium]